MKTNFERIADLSEQVKEKDRNIVLLIVAVVFLTIIAISGMVKTKLITTAELAEMLCKSQGYDTGRTYELDRATGMLELECTPLNSYKKGRINTGE